MIKRYPAPLAKTLGKKFFVKNLGTADLNTARRMRDRLLVELNDLAAKPSVDEAEILETVQAAEGETRDAIVY